MHSLNILTYLTHRARRGSFLFLLLMLGPADAQKFNLNYGHTFATTKYYEKKQPGSRYVFPLVKEIIFIQQEGICKVL